MNGPSQPGPADAELLGRLLDQHGAALALYAAQWTDAADDCVQEALVELARQPVVPENARAWLYRVVKHRALNIARGERRRRERESRAIARRLAGGDPPASMDRLETLAIAEALDRLEPSQRQIVVMRVWGSLTFEEIAAALSIALSTSHRQYRQALEHLRQILESPCSTSKSHSNTNCPPS